MEEEEGEEMLVVFSRYGISPQGGLGVRQYRLGYYTYLLKLKEFCLMNIILFTDNEYLLKNQLIV